jgi:hypothetical protein
VRAQGGDAGPAIADWNGDGRFDLIVGSGSGAVDLYLDTAKEGAPRLSSATSLVPEPDDDDPASSREATRPQSRTKPCVADWNGDGRLDLVVGDFASLQGPKPVLTPEQEKEKAALEAKIEEISPLTSQRYEAHRLLALKKLGIKPLPGEDLAPEQEEKVEATIAQALEKDPRWSKWMEQQSDVWESLSRFQPEHTTHGFVWVYLRAAS